MNAPIRGHCVEIHDLMISKLYVGRQKDIDFFHAAIQLQLITKEQLVERLNNSPLSDQQRDMIDKAIERGFHHE